jgi:tetratricopeptide (TPR) repeat protein
MRAAGRVWWLSLPLLFALGAAPLDSPVPRAERLAQAALLAAPEHPATALADARRALALTAEFEPIVFVRAGRKGEVVEDEFLAARQAYRRHRALLYEAVGECVLRSGQPLPAARYLRRALDLEATPDRRLRLARALVAQGRGSEALGALLSGASLPLSAAALAVAEQAADAAGLPSLQVELDLVRLKALSADPRPEALPTPFAVPERARLSSGGPLHFDSGVSVIYVAEASCRTCSADLEQIRRQVPVSTRVLVLPASADRDRELRQALHLYHYDWPVVTGAGTPQALGLKPPAAVVVSREGYAALQLASPFGASLAAVVALLGQQDVQETRPRPHASQAALRPGLAELPALLPEGLAAGEGAPEPPEFAPALAAFRAGHAAEALRLFGVIEARGDGWLLPPEARLNRAVALAAEGRREEARLLLLAIGDSRFQTEVDRTLERVGSPGKVH